MEKSTQKRLIFVTSRLPWPTNSGRKVSLYHYCRGLAEVFAIKAAGRDLEASDKFKEFAVRFGAYEVEIERYFDHHQFYTTYRPLLKEVATLDQ